MKFPARKAVKATAQNITRAAIFTPTMTVLATALSFAPRSSTTMARTTMAAAGMLRTPPAPGRRAERVGEGDPDGQVEQFVDVLPPAHRDGGHGHPVLQDQTPAAHPGAASSPTYAQL